MSGIQNEVVQYLDAATLMQVATFVNNRPWVATVFFAADNSHNLYWLSLPTARHSQEIARNGRVAAAITMPYYYGQASRGLQLEGVAGEVPMSDIDTFIQAYAERFNAHTRLQAIKSGQDEYRLYRLVPEVFVLYDEANFASNPRQEWHIANENAPTTEIALGRDEAGSSSPPSQTMPDTSA